MVSLLDLKRRTVTVPTSGGDVVMNAISAKSIAHLIGGFPFIASLLEGKVEEVTFKAADIVNQAPKLAAELIACGADMPGNPEAIKAAEEAAIGDQVELLAGVLEASLPSGPGPFLAAVKKLAGTLSGTGLKALASA